MTTEHQSTNEGAEQTSAQPIPRTEKQKSTARLNGAKSRGPVTPEGNANPPATASAKSIVLEGESRKQFAALLKAFCEELRPESHVEDLLVQKMAVNHWRQERIWSQQKTHALQRSNSGEISQPEPRLATHMNMTEMRYDRQFDRALNRLLQYRAAREKAESRGEREQ